MALTLFHLFTWITPIQPADLQLRTSSRTPSSTSNNAIPKHGLEVNLVALPYLLVICFTFQATTLGKQICGLRCAWTYSQCLAHSTLKEVYVFSMDERMTKIKTTIV